MIESMTGYGKSVLQLPSKKVTIEIKTLNSKNLDIIARIPSDYKEKELEIRKKLAKKLVRGKVTFGLYIEATGIDDSVKINTQMVKKYLKELETLYPKSNENLLAIAMNLPDTISSIKGELDPKEWKIVEEYIDKAIAETVNYRQTEGDVLEKDFVERVTIISDLLEQIDEYDTERKQALRDKLTKAIEELHQKVDENRFEQEMIYYLEKLDITEEQVRLKNHLSYFIEMLNTSDSNGKKLGFIAQEMGREINTIGSKANFANMQKIVIQMKDELEKIKEQNLNIR
ncbi:MAG TPA: YicC family protein [Lutibacter sp.]|nr:YicC family protein [Lutibacter sp.]